MSVDLKRCKQCGILKDANCFRQYTYSKSKGTQGRYSICRECESINQNYRRAKKFCQEHNIDEHSASYSSVKGAALWAQVCQIERLYDMLKGRGLRVPNITEPQQSSDPVNDIVKKLSDFYATSDQPVTVGQSTVDRTVSTDELPDDLAGWLNGDWHDWRDQGMSPEYLQETVYESLKAKYRPQTGFDRETGLPIYDDTYKTELNNILRLFDDYEEAVAEEEEDGGKVYSQD